MEKYRKPYKKIKYKTSALTWGRGGGEFELLDVSNYVSDIQDYSEYIIKKHERATDNPLIMMCVKK